MGASDEVVNPVVAADSQSPGTPFPMTRDGAIPVEILVVFILSVGVQIHCFIKKRKRV